MYILFLKSSRQEIMQGYVNKLGKSKSIQEAILNPSIFVICRRSNSGKVIRVPPATPQPHPNSTQCIIQIPGSERSKTLHFDVYKFLFSVFLVSYIFIKKFSSFYAFVGLNQYHYQLPTNFPSRKLGESCI